MTDITLVIALVPLTVLVVAVLICCVISLILCVIYIKECSRSQQGGSRSLYQQGGSRSRPQQGDNRSVYQQGGSRSVYQQGGSRSLYQQGGSRSLYRQGGSRSRPQQVGSSDHFTASIRLPLVLEQTKKIPNKIYERLVSVESCGICFEELKDGDEVRDLPCGHNNFHASCLDQWLLTCNRSCPLCRHNVTKQRPAPQARASGVKESSNSLLSDVEDQNYGTV